MNRLIVFTDSTYAITQIGKIIEGKLPHVRDYNHNTLNRIAKVIKYRRDQGQCIVLEHVYSHQTEKLNAAHKQGFKGREKASNILASNCRLNRLYPEVNTERGNQKADKLANKGRLVGKIDFIPECMEAFIVQDTRDSRVLNHVQIKNKITTDSKTEWNRKWDKNIDSTEKWWDDEASNWVVNYPDPRGDTVRRARNRCLKSTRYLKGTLHYANDNNVNRYALKQAVSSGYCLKCKTEEDDQLHQFECTDSRLYLAKIRKAVDTEVAIVTLGARMPTFWLNGKQSVCPVRYRRIRDRKGWRHKRKYLGTLGYVPKTTLSKLEKVVGPITAMNMAKVATWAIAGVVHEMTTHRLDRIKACADQRRREILRMKKFALGHVQD